MAHPRVTPPCHTAGTPLSHHNYRFFGLTLLAPKDGESEAAGAAGAVSAESVSEQLNRLSNGTPPKRVAQDTSPTSVMAVSAYLTP